MSEQKPGVPTLTLSEKEFCRKQLARWSVQLSIGLNRTLALVAEKGESQAVALDCCVAFLIILAIHAHVKPCRLLAGE
jgi:hypothetical protein